jgi:receptor protein-tyrosine kinase
MSAQSVQLGNRNKAKPARGAGRNVYSHIKQILDDPTLATSFGKLRAFLGVPAVSKSPFALAFTAALYDEGATSSALGLAVMLAYEEDARVVIIDCDLAHPGLHARLGITNSPGLSEAMAGKAPVESVLRRTILPNLRAMPAGSNSRPVGLQEARELRRWLGNFIGLGQFDYVILDMPPVNASLATRELTAIADAVALVVRAGATPREELLLAISRLAQRRIAGIVINGARPKAAAWATGLIDADEVEGQ